MLGWLGENSGYSCSKYVSIVRLFAKIKKCIFNRLQFLTFKIVKNETSTRGITCVELMINPL